MLGYAVAGPELDEAEMAKRYAAITRSVTPEFAFVLQHLFNLHMRDQLSASSGPPVRTIRPPASTWTKSGFT